MTKVKGISNKGVSDRENEIDLRAPTRLVERCCWFLTGFGALKLND